MAYFVVSFSPRQFQAPFFLFFRGQGESLKMAETGRVVDSPFIPAESSPSQFVSLSPPIWKNSFFLETLEEPVPDQGGQVAHWQSNARDFSGRE